MANHKTGPDPLAEAEVCIAYGRLEQAAQILREAIEREPNRKDLWDKLAEIIRRKPSVGASPTAAFKGSSGHGMDADGTKVFRVRIIDKISLSIISGFFIFMIAFLIHDLLSGPLTRWLFLAIAILYILFIIDFISCSIILTEDRMIVSRIARRRYFNYAEMGKIYLGYGGKSYYIIILYNHI